MRSLGPAWTVIGLGILQYSQDYDERFPRVDSNNAAGDLDSNGVPFQQTIQPYMKSTQVFAYPSNSGTTLLANTPTNGRIFNHYLGNGGNDSSAVTSGGLYYPRPLDSIDTSDNKVARSLSEAVEPSRTLLVAEYEGTRGRPEISSISTTGGMNFTNHLGNSNYLFADGHVKALKPSATISGGSMWALDPVNAAVQSALRIYLGTQEASMQ